ncbi:hypothetical protein AB0F34_25640, partial [Streptomyces fradiae]
DGSGPVRDGSGPVRDAAPAASVPRTAAALPVRTPPGGARPGGGDRPPLPERVPQTHLAAQLRVPPPAAERGGGSGPDPGAGRRDRAEATPEEVADAWADYEDGTRKVEAELRREQP